MKLSFSLRNLLAFVLATCLYLAALRSAAVIVRGDRVEGFSSVTAILIGSWFLLGCIYTAWRLYSALIIHLFGPAAAVVIAAIIAVRVEGCLAHVTLAELGIAALAVGCALGTVVSFPITILVLLDLASRRHREPSPRSRPPPG